MSLSPIHKSMDTNTKAFLEITAISHVTGKDENGVDLPLTRITSHRFDKNVETGETSPNDNDLGQELFIGSLDIEASVKAVTALCLPEWNIEVTVAEGVQEPA